MRNRTRTQSPIGILCAIVFAAGFAGYAHAEEYQKSYAVNGQADVQVHAQFGAVRVTTSDTEKVEFDVRYDKNEWGSAPSIDSRQDGNVVELTALVDKHQWWSWWGSFRSRRLSIDVRMPKNGDLQLETVNASVNVASVNGKITIRTANGGVSAQRLSGMIDIGTTNGPIHLDALKGSVKVHTTNGAITATGLDGKSELSTTNGHVQIAGRFDALNITSANGGIVARVEPGSRLSDRWNIQTTNAGVDLTVPADLNANLDATTTHGRISLDVPVKALDYLNPAQVRGVLHGGGPEMSITTTNGGIHLRGI